MTIVRKKASTFNDNDVAVFAYMNPLDNRIDINRNYHINIILWLYLLIRRRRLLEKEDVEANWQVNLSGRFRRTNKRRKIQ